MPTLAELLGMAQQGVAQAEPTAPAEQDIRSDLIQQLFQSINAPQGEAPQLPVPPEVGFGSRLGAALLSLSGDQNALARLQAQQQQRQEVMQQNALLGARAEQQGQAARASAIQTLLSQTGQDLDRALRKRGQNITVRGQDLTAQTALMRELGLDERTAAKLAEDTRRFGVTSGQRAQEMAQDFNIAQARLELDKQKFTAAEAARVRTDRKSEVAEVRRLVAKFPNAFPDGFDTNTATFDEAAKILRDSGFALDKGTIPATVKTEIADMRASVKSINEAAELFEELGQPGGPLATFGRPVFARSRATKQFDSVLQRAVVQIRRALFGTAFTANERETGLALLPEITADATTMRFALQSLQQLIEDKLNNRLEIFGDPRSAGTTETISPDTLPPGFNPVPQ